MHITATIKSCTPSFLKKYIERIESSPIGLRLARGAFWSFVGAIISRGLMLLSSIIIARILGKAVFGELGIIHSTVGMFGVFAGFGLGMTSTKYVAEFREKDPAKAGRIIALAEIITLITGLIMMIALIIFAPFLASKTLAAPHLAGLLRIGSILLFLNAINSVQTGSLAGFESFRTIANINFFVGLASFPILLTGVYFGKLSGVVWGHVGTMLFSYILNYMAIKKETDKYKIKIDYFKSLQEKNVLYKFSIPACLSGIMVLPVTWICNTMLVNTPNGYAEMGIFNAANQWYIAILFLPGIFGQALLPILSERLGKNDKERPKKVLSAYIKLNLFIVVPLVIVGVLLRHGIMGFYGTSFTGSGNILIIVLFTAALLSIQIPVGNIIIAAGKMWLGFMMNTGWGIVFIIGTILLVKYGAIGLASSRLISYIFHMIWTFGFTYYFLKRYK
jgi:O-antigen/teichoic acid export membrane protein